MPMSIPGDKTALADRIEATKRSWLPIAGHVVNVTFDLAEADMICAALRTAATRDDPVREALISAGCTSRDGTIVHDSIDRVLAAIQGAKP